ncbi:MAG: sulfurtransferase complex subunit TusC [Halioglobus sp.]|nr:sulfurtransferase complex subunit TusC [Halioglobus sp.]
MVFTHSPYGSSLAGAGLDAALASAAFEQPVDLLFIGDGVLQLQSKQDNQALKIKHMGKVLASLPLYGIDRVYVDAKAVSRYQLDLDASLLATEALEPDKMHKLMVDYDHLLSF